MASKLSLRFFLLIVRILPVIFVVFIVNDFFVMCYWWIMVENILVVSSRHNLAYLLFSLKVIELNSVDTKSFIKKIIADLKYLFMFVDWSRDVNKGIP